MDIDDDAIKCLHCASDLRESGILEFGLVTFDIDLAWKADQGFFSGIGEPRYDECTEIRWQCKHCGHDLPTNPDDFAAGDY